MKKILKWAGIIFLVLIVLAVIMPKSDTKNVDTSKEATVSAEKKVDEGITMEKFTKLEEGMSYEEVVTILGAEGEVSSESNMAGYETVLYTWKGSFGANMNAMFQNNKMVSKAQFGLK